MAAFFYLRSSESNDFGDLFLCPDAKVHDLLTERHEVLDLYFTWVFIFFIIASSLFVYQLVIFQKISCKFADAYYISY